MADKLSITAKIIAKEILLPALRYTAPRVAVFFALQGINVTAGFRSVGTRMCQTLYPMIKAGEALLRGNRGTSGATGRWKALLGLRSSDLTEEERESELLALLLARAMPNERMSMACYMLSGLSAAELSTACQGAFGEVPGKAFASIVKSVAKFIAVSTEIVKADIKKSAGGTQNLTSSASDAVAETRMSQAQALLKDLTEEKD